MRMLWSERMFHCSLKVGKPLALMRSPGVAGVEFKRWRENMKSAWMTFEHKVREKTKPEGNALVRE